ncbi:hypothetical protein [Roseovarius sp. ZX-A-9]|uniref:hypothetical protein n=1 Tax=Roseovarius sp. ZX-A-9 TaxID=3014783 RepID=UPI00232D4425|nr:hypothetical protein [Roseovarius sp. ZX-A-9]MDX1785281.1 hypothetical protein [Roseovarius sp.]
MRWLNKILGKAELLPCIELAHTRGYTHAIVGEASYQDNIEKIVGGKGQYSAKYECMATLECENNNPHDENAVAVKIGKRLVGYLAREDAASYRSELQSIDASLPLAQVRAKIVGGWRDAESEGHFGVKLNLKRPLQKAKN